MAAIDFPDNPELNESFTVGRVTYVWNGTVWNSVGSKNAGPAGVDGGRANTNYGGIMGVDGGKADSF
jgi:hypothetical protein